MTHLEVEGIWHTAETKWRYGISKIGYVLVTMDLQGQIDFTVLLQQFPLEVIYLISLLKYYKGLCKVGKNELAAENDI